jgi:ABC-type transporter Mla subunit MlaD
MSGFEVPVHDAEVLSALGRIEALLRRSIAATTEHSERIDAMATDLTQLAAEVEGNTDVVASAEAVFTRLADELSAAGGNQEEVDRITSQLREQKGRLAQAVAANTPASGDGGPVVDNTLPGDLPGNQ